MKKEIFEDKIEFIDEEKNERMGYVTFPMIEKNVVNLNHTIVNSNYQGVGLAGKLVQEVVDLAKEKEYKIIPTCSYAVKWFEKHPEYEDLKK